MRFFYKQMPSRERSHQKHTSSTNHCLKVLMDLVSVVRAMLAPLGLGLSPHYFPSVGALGLQPARTEWHTRVVIFPTANHPLHLHTTFQLDHNIQQSARHEPLTAAPGDGAADHRAGCYPSVIRTGF